MKWVHASSARLSPFRLSIIIALRPAITVRTSTPTCHAMRLSSSLATSDVVADERSVNANVNERSVNVNERAVKADEIAMKELEGSAEVEESAVVEGVRSELHITEASDWYAVPRAHMVWAVQFSHMRLAAKPTQFLNRFPTVEALVTHLYPTHKWEAEKFAHSRTADVPIKFLGRVIRGIFPPATLIEYSSTAHGLVTENGAPMLMNFYLPDLLLGFQYQDENDYFFTTYGVTTLAQYKSKDLFKKDQARKKGITLVIVPYWWKWDRGSLIASINTANTKLLSKSLVNEATDPIPTDPPKDILEKFSFDIPGLGALMLAAHPPKHFSPENWLVFEKYDGIRAVFHGTEHQFYSRWGKVFSLPHFLVASMSLKTWLDGEFWLGREQEAMYQVIRSGTAMHTVDWSRLKYIVFDCPHPDMRRKSYADRYAALVGIVSNAYHPLVNLATYEVCKSADHLKKLFIKVRAAGGEGIIMRDPGASYLGGYSHALYKFKGIPEAVAQVISHSADSKFLCRIKKAHLIANSPTNQSVFVQQDPSDNHSSGHETYPSHMSHDQTLYQAPLEQSSPRLDLESHTAPKKCVSPSDDEYHYIEMTVDAQFSGKATAITPGAFISFMYDSLSTTGEPLSPKIYALRSNMTNWGQAHKKRKPPDVLTTRAPLSLKRWTKEGKRSFMENFAKRKNADPLSPAFWYTVFRTELWEAGAKWLDSYPSFIVALRDVFPEVSFDESKLPTPRAMWNSFDKIKAYLELVAKQKGFDPRVPENWYTVNHKDFDRNRFKKFKMSYTEAIIAAFPDIGLDRLRFSHVTRRVYWQDIRNVKKFLEAYAAKHGFDPLVADNWYKEVDVFRISAMPAGPSFLQYFKVLVEPIVAAYPELGLDAANFHAVPRYYWANPVNQQKAFSAVAQLKRFRADQPRPWYSLRSADFYRVKGAGHILRHYYNNDVAAAVMGVFPDLPLAYDKFKYNKGKRQNINSQQ